MDRQDEIWKAGRTSFIYAYRSSLDLFMNNLEGLRVRRDGSPESERRQPWVTAG